MTRLHDDNLLMGRQTAERTPPNRLTADMRAALEHVGDKTMRSIEDRIGVYLEDERRVGQWSVGDEASFVLPDGVRRQGSISRFAAEGVEAVINVGYGEHAVIPLVLLEAPIAQMTRDARSAELDDLIQNNRSPIHEVNCEEIEPRVYESKLQFSASFKPSEDDVLLFLERQHARTAAAGLGKEVALRILDGDSWPGGARVVFAMEVLAQTYGPQVPAPEQNFRRSPALFSEPIDGTGQPALDPTLKAGQAQADALAAAHPEIEFQSLGAESVEGRSEIKFAMVRSSDKAPLRISAARTVTAVRNNSVKAQGRIVSDAHGSRVFVETPRGEVSWASLRLGAYENGQGPASTHENDDVTRDTVGVPRMDVAPSDDREHIGGPGLNVASVEKPRSSTKEYFNKLFKDSKDFAEALTDEIDKTRAAKLIEAMSAKGRVATPKFLAAALSAMAKDGGKKASAGDSDDVLVETLAANPALLNAPVSRSALVKVAKKRKDKDDGEERDLRPMPPGSGDLHFTFDNARARGSYVHLTVEWDPKKVTGLNPDQLRQQIINRVKGMASQNNATYGWTAGVKVMALDFKGGAAEVRMRSTAWKSFPQEVITV